MNRIYILTLVVITFYSCNKSEEIQNHDLTGNWKVISFENYETDTIITKTETNTWSQFNNGDITVNFKTSNSISGLISGRNVTNTFSGNYTIDKEGGIAINNVIWTEIGEPEWARLFHSILLAAEYEINDDLLILYYNQKKNSITLINQN